MTKNKMASSCKQWIAKNGWLVSIESPKDYQTESYQTIEAGSTSFLIPVGLPKLPEGCVVKEEFDKLTGKVSIYFKPGSFEGWWKQFIAIIDNKFILEASIRSESFRGFVDGKTVIFTAEKFAEMQAAKLKSEAGYSSKKTFYYHVCEGEDQEITFNQEDLGEAEELSNIYSYLGDFEKEPSLEDVVERLLELERSYEN